MCHLCLNKMTTTTKTERMNSGITVDAYQVQLSNFNKCLSINCSFFHMYCDREILVGSTKIKTKLPNHYNAKHYLFSFCNIMKTAKKDLNPPG